MEACRSMGEHGLQVVCVFSQEDAFVLQLKVDEKGGWGLVIDKTNCKFIRPQIIPPANPGMSIWAFRKPNEGIVLLFGYPDGLWTLLILRERESCLRCRRRPLHHATKEPPATRVPRIDILVVKFS